VISSARALLGLLLLGAPTALPAQEAAVPPALAARVAREIAGRWGVEPDHLRLEWGRVSARSELAPDAPFRLLGRGEGGWYAIVAGPAASPVAVRVRAGSVDSVAVAARAVAARAPLAAEDVRLEARVRWGAPREGGSFRPMAGWLAARALRAGDELRPTDVSAPPAVAAGEPVRLGWRRGGVVVEMEGTAMSAGAIGQTIPVRLRGRAGQRTGVVTAPGVVRMTS